MPINQEKVDEYINKAKEATSVLAEGANDAYVKHEGPVIVASLWARTTQLAGSVVNGVTKGTQTPVETPSQRERQAAMVAVQHPGKNIYSLAFVAGTMTALGVGRYLIDQEVALRTSLRAVDRDWSEDVGDGMVGPINHMYRPFFAGIDHHLQSAATPRGKTLGQKVKNWWIAGTNVTANPTEMKQMYHGLMAVCHSLSFVVRFRYHLATGRPSSLGGGSQADINQAVASPDAVEQFAFEVASFFKRTIKGKLAEKQQPKVDPKTRSGEHVPPVGPIAVGGSLALAIWHWGQFARCYAQKGGALAAPLHKYLLIGPITHFIQSHVSAKLLKIAACVNANLETLALLGESVAAVTGGLQLLAPCSTRFVAATAALRLATFGKLVATTHRLFDDSAHTLHNYGSLDRQMIFVASTGLALSSVLTPRACDYSGVFRTFSILSRGVGISAFFRGRGIFSQPHAIRTTDPKRNTVYDTFTATVLSYGICFAISLAGAHHGKTQLTGLALLGGMLYGIHRVVKKQEEVGGAGSAGGDDGENAPLLQSAGAQGPPSYGTATKVAPTETSDNESPDPALFEDDDEDADWTSVSKDKYNHSSGGGNKKQSAPLPQTYASSSSSSSSSDGFDHVHHDDVAHHDDGHLSSTGSDAPIPAGAKEDPSFLPAQTSSSSSSDGVTGSGEEAVGDDDHADHPLYGGKV